MTARKTLGARLREQEAERGKHGMVSARYLSAVGLDRYNALEAMAEAFFNKVRTTLAADIEANRKPTVHQMSESEPFRIGRSPINEPDNPFHYLWNGFEDWLTVNELRCELKWTHDGGGIRGWANVTITAAEPPGTP